MVKNVFLKTHIQKLNIRLFAEAEHPPKTETQKERPMIGGQW